MSKIEDAVIKKIKQRAYKGLNTYGVTMERDDLTRPQWLQHLQEELLDGAVYVQKLMEISTEELQEKLLAFYNEEEDDAEIERMEDLRNERMNVIGQNGNDGLHYDDEEVVLNIHGATVTMKSPCVSHGHWSHGYSMGDTFTLSDERFTITEIGDKHLVLSYAEEA